MIGYPSRQDGVILPARDCPSGQDGAILPARDCPFVPARTFAEVQAGARKFSFPKYFHDSKKIFSDFSVRMELENKKTEMLYHFCI